MRVNCGGQPYVGAGGRIFHSDQAYASGGWGYAGGWSQDVWCPIGGSPDSTLYRDVRFARNPFHYRFDVPNGSYDITLRFAEVNGHWHGLTVMRVLAESVPLLDSLDVFAEVERAYALDARFRIGVTDGRLDLRFEPQVGGAQVAAIEVLDAAAAAGPPPTPDALAVTPGYGCLIVNWADAAATDLKGYELVRRRLPEGPAEVVVTPNFLLSRFIDEDVAPGAEYAYQARAVDLSGLCSPPGPWVAGRVLRRDESSLADYELRVTAENLVLLNTDVWSEAYVPAEFLHAGQTWSDAGVRYRGSSNREGPKKNWKVLFGGEPFEDQDRLNLNSGYADPSLVREALGFQTAALAGALSCETRRVNLYLNGQHRGLHTQIEQIDEGWLTRRGMPEDCPVFKCGDGLFYHHPDIYYFFHEREVGPPDDFTPLAAFIDLITHTTEEAFPDSIARVLDVYDFMRWYAFQILYANLDFATHNFYAVQHATTGRWRFVPWDLDVTLGCAATYVHDYDPETAIDLGTQAHPDARGYNALIERLLRHEVFRWMHARTLLELLDGPLAAEALLGAHAARLAEIATDVPADYHKWGWEATAHHADDVARTRVFIEQRCAFLREAAERYRPPLDFGVRLNELMAANGATIADEHGEYEDWIEIVNTSDAPVSLGGLRLSDDLHNPRVWTFPDTTLAPGGFVLVWADEDLQQGPLHAAFRLNRNGEALALWAGDAQGNALIDHVTFGPQVTDVSLGRIPDGWGDWTLMEAPTPGGSNGLPADVTPPAGPGPGTPALADCAARRPALRISPVPAAGRVTFTRAGPGPDPCPEPCPRADPVAGPWRISLHDIQGRRVAAFELRAGRPALELELGGPRGLLPAGTYWALLRGPDGMVGDPSRLILLGGE